MYDVSKIIEKPIWQELLDLLPTPKQQRFGRKRCQKGALLSGILQVLVNGVAWKKMAECGCSYASCFRYFQELQRRGKLKLVYQALSRQKSELVKGAIDTTTVTSYAFTHGTGWDGKNHVIGTKVSLFTNVQGLPLDVDFGKGNTDDRKILIYHLKNTYGRRKKLITLDMGYMSLALRRMLRTKGIRVNSQLRTQDFRRKRGPKFRFDPQLYEQRSLMEKTFAWLKAFRSLILRRSYHLANFKAFVYLALIIILIRS